MLKMKKLGTIVPLLVSPRSVSRNCTEIPFGYPLQRRGYAAPDKKNNLDARKTPANFHKYWISRYMDYIKTYQRTLEQNFPRAMRVYRIFSIGSRDFFSDLRRYVSVRKKHRVKGLDALTLEELQLWHTFPGDLIKISPLLIICAIPLTNYVVFPMALMFPRLLLTSHFWSLEQRFNFTSRNQKNRLRRNKPLLRCVQSQSTAIKNPLLKIKWDGIMACVGSGTHPTPSEVVSCVDLFAGPPYSLDSLTRKHTVELLAIHGMHRWGLNRKQRLFERGILMRSMDKAIRKEGGVTKLPNDAMRWALSFRGVNPVNMSRERMQDWLEQWLEISSRVDERSVSLLLHAPLLLAYNQPTNWTLLYH